MPTESQVSGGRSASHPPSLPWRIRGSGMLLLQVRQFDSSLPPCHPELPGGVQITSRPCVTFSLCWLQVGSSVSSPAGRRSKEFSSDSWRALDLITAVTLSYQVRGGHCCLSRLTVGFVGDGGCPLLKAWSRGSCHGALWMWLNYSSHHPLAPNQEGCWEL